MGPVVEARVARAGGRAAAGPAGGQAPRRGYCTVTEPVKAVVLLVPTWWTTVKV